MATEYIGTFIVLCKTHNCCNPISTCNVVEGTVGTSRSKTQMCNKCTGANVRSYFKHHVVNRNHVQDAGVDAVTVGRFRR